MASNLLMTGKAVTVTEANAWCLSGYSHHFGLAPYVVKVLKGHAIAQSAVARVSWRCPRTPLQALLQQASRRRCGLNRWYVLTYPDVVCMVVRFNCEHNENVHEHPRLHFTVQFCWMGRFFLFSYWRGMRPSPLILRPQMALLYQLLMTDECGVLKERHLRRGHKW
jgi:hypothetical protein